MCIVLTKRSYRSSLDLEAEGQVAVGTRFHWGRVAGLTRISLQKSFRQSATMARTRLLLASTSVSQVPVVCRLPLKGFSRVNGGGPSRI